MFLRKITVKMNETNMYMETLHKRCVALALSEMESTDDLEIVERCNSDYDDNLVFRVMMIL